MRRSQATETRVGKARKTRAESLSAVGEMYPHKCQAHFPAATYPGDNIERLRSAPDATPVLTPVCTPSVRVSWFSAEDGMQP